MEDKNPFLLQTENTDYQLGSCEEILCTQDLEHGELAECAETQIPEQDSMGQTGNTPMNISQDLSELIADIRGIFQCGNENPRDEGQRTDEEQEQARNEQHWLKSSSDILQILRLAKGENPYLQLVRRSMLKKRIARLLLCLLQKAEDKNILLESFTFDSHHSEENGEALSTPVSTYRESEVNDFRNEMESQSDRSLVGSKISHDSLDGSVFYNRSSIVPEREVGTRHLRDRQHTISELNEDVESSKSDNPLGLAPEENIAVNEQAVREAPESVSMIESSETRSAMSSEDSSVPEQEFESPSERIEALKEELLKTLIETIHMMEWAEKFEIAASLLQKEIDAEGLCSGNTGKSSETGIETGNETHQRKRRRLHLSNHEDEVDSLFSASTVLAPSHLVYRSSAVNRAHNQLPINYTQNLRSLSRDFTAELQEVEEIAREILEEFES